MDCVIITSWEHGNQRAGTNIYYSTTLFSYASNISVQDKAKIDNIMTVVERDWGRENIFTQISKYEKFMRQLTIIFPICGVMVKRILPLL